jgi:hypothetical protein
LAGDERRQRPALLFARLHAGDRPIRLLQRGHHLVHCFLSGSALAMNCSLPSLSVPFATRAGSPSMPMNFALNF